MTSRLVMLRRRSLTKLLILEMPYMTAELRLGSGYLLASRGTDDTYILDETVRAVTHDVLTPSQHLHSSIDELQAGEQSLQGCYKEETGPNKLQTHSP